MIFLALDQSSHISGYGIFDNKKLIKQGIFSFNDKDISKRLLNICNTIKQLVTDNKIEFVVFEDIQLQSKVTNNI